MARHTAPQVGTHLAGWFSAQPLYDWINQVEPDLFGSTEPVVASGDGESWDMSRACARRRQAPHAIDLRVKGR